MQQILQNLKNGRTYIAEVPPPIATPGKVVIKTTASLISAGTERMLVEFGRSSLIAKAKSQPERVKQVLDKFKTDGVIPTMEAVFKRLDEPLPLGYCNAGVVVDVGAGVHGFKRGDRVISNGSHAEFVSVPHNLCAKIPDTVSDEEAAFTVLSSIALQGIRLMNPTLGEKIVVFGLGLIGIIAVQLLRANGCEVLGIDTNKERIKLAESFGAETVHSGVNSSPVGAVMHWSQGKGADGVIITASAKKDQILHQSAAMSRKRGRIILVGVIDLNMHRTDFYEKELSFQVSCSYGPGRYDDKYEQQGIDYPFGYVRWTEQRNFEAVLAAMRNGNVNVLSLISHRFQLQDAVMAYQEITNGKNTLGVILQYPKFTEEHPSPTITMPYDLEKTQSIRTPRIGVIGAGNFSKMTLLPALHRTDAIIAGIADLNGMASQYLAEKYNALTATTDYTSLLKDHSINAIIVAVGHNLHAMLVCESLNAGKHVFVEKPLAMNVDEVKKIVESYRKNPGLSILVGFNRRQSPHILHMKKLLFHRVEPLAMTMTINAGMIPPEHWVHDPKRGGGRIIGEACHFIDLMVFLTGSRVQSVAAHQMNNSVLIKEDKMSISLGFDDGSVGTINYFANGSKSYPKETLEVFSDGKVLRMDNFRKTTAVGFGPSKNYRTFSQDKGHSAQFKTYVEQLRSGSPPFIPFDEIVNTTLASFAAMTAANERRTIILAKEYKGLV